MRVVGEAFMDSSSYLAEAEKLLDNGFLICLVREPRMLEEVLVAYKKEEEEDIVLFLACIKNWVYYQFFLKRDIIRRVVNMPEYTLILVLDKKVKCIVDTKENVIKGLEKSIDIFREVYKPDDKLYYHNMLLDISRNMQFYILRGLDCMKVFPWALGLSNEELVIESVDNSYTIHFVR